MFMSKTAVLSCFANARGTALVYDSGATMSSAGRSPACLSASKYRACMIGSQQCTQCNMTPTLMRVQCRYTMDGSYPKARSLHEHTQPHIKASFTCELNKLKYTPSFALRRQVWCGVPWEVDSWTEQYSPCSRTRSSPCDRGVCIGTRRALV